MNKNKSYTLKMSEEQSIFLEGKYNKIKKTYPLVKNIKNILVNEYNNSFIVLNEKNDLDTKTLHKLINEGFFIETYNGDNLIMQTMKQSSCHENSYIYYKIGLENGLIYSIMTGYALSDDGLWREHSWLINEYGDVIETTVKRVAYYGYIIDNSEIELLDHYYG